jgi:1,2-diacylglycerol 3-alpha-glucosyltransferase
LNRIAAGMKILMIIDFYGIGQQYQENLLAKYYALAGHEVHIICSTFKDIFSYNTDAPNISSDHEVENDGNAVIYRTPYKIKYKNLFKVFEDISPRVEAIKPDLIYIHNIILNIHQVTDYLDRNSQARMIMDFHIDYSNAGQSWKARHFLHGFIRKHYLNRYLKYFAAIFSIVPNSTKFLNEIYKIPLNRIQLLPLGYDEEVSERIRATTDRNEIRKQLGIGENNFVVISGGKLVKEKRTDLLINAIKKINRKDIHLVLFGEALSETDPYNLLLKESSEGVNVHFLGWLNGEQILTRMNAADLAVFPASQSVLWQQSIGMYLPLMVGDSGNQDPTYLNKNNNMIILKREEINTEVIAEKISMLLNSPDLLQSMKEGAQKTAQEYLKYSKICEKTLSEAFKN